VPTIASLLFLYSNGCGEQVLTFSSSPTLSNIYSISVLASLSCCCGDTFASELGTVLGGWKKSKKSRNENVFHVTKWKRVPRGTNGGVSVWGTLASLLGGFCVGLAYYLTLLAVRLFSFWNGLCKYEFKFIF
jgi:uncharacterized membrane protein